ncbi:E3 ubiquitin-protein ligase TRIM39-like [Salmo salar]|uniref:E3 ubiquitin-protein ligase TRIM39-like n=1 Tax=Salmo salar TaxID=8030 RepID=A0A1S3PZV6_SALSA|nr:E3 ubiquitin-protein ligase TRIM39-like [Salmo salar]XP_014033175.1 E3 ubiquitin-protein ligase TRIM39-like [Salmo salar]|eukprot:XP_014033166.1 PREDICTED: E3 ubiquitin-protein ligase TRIM39-like [Salmo salar]
MASPSSLLSEEQFQCSICLDVFTDPVSIPCGHNFCKACIKGYWDSTGLFQCPLCKQIFHIRPEPDVNRTLRGVAELFKVLIVRDREDFATEPGEVVCDVCTGRKRKALKSCMVCLTSYCETHLEPHQIAPALKRHQLINPVKNLEDRMCKKHNKLLELFCRTDQTCVCQFCSETDHKAHNSVPLEEEYDQRKSQLGKTEAQVKQMIQERLQKVKEIKHSVDLSKKHTEREMSDKVQIFTALVHSIDKCKDELICVIEQKQEATEKWAEGIIKELEQEITELKRISSELGQLTHTKDHLQLLQSSPSWCLPVKAKDWSEISVQSHLHMGYMKRAVSQLEDKLTSEVKRFHNEMENELKKLCEAEMTILQYAVNVTLDPDTAYPELILSVDGKQVRCGDQSQDLSNNPKRFTYIYSVLGKEGFSSGKSYYEVQVKGKTEWDLGVATESINRQGWLPLSHEDGVWTLGLSTNNYYEANDPKVQLSLKRKPQKVGVFVDYEEGRVSIYDVDATARSHICSFTGHKFTEKLYPYFHCGYPDGERNIAPLVISPVSQMTGPVLH